MPSSTRPDGQCYMYVTLAIGLHCGYKVRWLQPLAARYRQHIMRQRDVACTSGGLRENAAEHRTRTHYTSR